MKQKPRSLQKRKHPKTHLRLPDLEFSKTAVLQTRVVEECRHHPVDRMLRTRLPLGINTDVQTITNISLNQQYARLRQHFGWGNPGFAACNRAALDAAFLDEPTKKRLTARFTGA